MRFHYDKKVDALYIRFNDKRYFESDEVLDGIIFDYDRKGRILGIEVLCASKRLPREFNAEIKKKTIPLFLDFKAPTEVLR